MTRKEYETKKAIANVVITFIGVLGVVGFIVLIPAFIDGIHQSLPLAVISLVMTLITSTAAIKIYRWWDSFQ